MNRTGVRLALGGFLLIGAGVFVALSVEDWASRRAEGELAATYLRDLIAAGASVALSAEDWASRRAEGELAVTYLQDLFVDLERDSIQIAQWSRRAEGRVAAITELLARLDGGSPAVGARSLEALWWASLVPVPYSSPATYKDLVSTGNVRLLGLEIHRELLMYMAELDRIQTLQAIWGIDKPSLMSRVSRAYPGVNPCVGSSDFRLCMSELADERYPDLSQADREAIRTWNEAPGLREELQMALSVTYDFLRVIEETRGQLQAVMTVARE